jgi:hypothetical protein
MSRSHGVSVRLSAEMLARRDDIAASWGLNRAATVRRLVGLADVDARPVGVPTMDELVVIASEKARCGSMAAARPCGSPTSAKRTSNGCSTDSDRGRNECARVGCAPGAWREAESGGDRAGRQCVTEERRSQGADAVPVGRAGHGRGSVDAARQFTALISFRTSRRRAVSVGFVNAAGSPRPRKSPVLEVRPVTYGSWRYCRAVGPSCRRRGAPDATRYRPAPRMPAGGRYGPRTSRFH